jgi:hypothetical protein
MFRSTMKSFGSLTMVLALVLAAAGPCWAAPCAASPCSMPDCSSGGSQWQAVSSCCCSSPGAPAGRTGPLAEGTLAKGASSAWLPPGSGETVRPAAIDMASITATIHPPASPLFLLNTSFLI